MNSNTLKGIGAILEGVAGFSQAGADVLAYDKPDFGAAYTNVVKGKDAVMRGLGLLGVHNEILKAMEPPVATPKPKSE